ncbi:septation protein A [Paracidovorax anthurii]|uniref:Inner membrane-spanning protein YciB n=1 Tax=Paracidovorax anthurii TaxID=78229 RepID=A0A328YQQ0_9BURK|nr:septation protein A [Paracidovorax anthurii]RAR76368.1 intracellular septation protein [Paracidovorax anthurii]WCM95083.1 septation protein A [Acidovorax sp. NCPPB 2350]
MKLLIDFFPIILFFAAFKLWGIYTATAVAIAATVLQIAYLRVRHGRVEPMQWVSLGVIVVFGGATLLAHSETFIKWKPTVLYWLMAAALLIGQFVFHKNLIRSLMGAQMELPDAAWRAMNWSWTAFFAAMGFVNLWVAYTFSTDAWVNFKLFGGLGLMAVFVVGQALYLSRYIKEGENKPSSAEDAQP